MREIILKNTKGKDGKSKDVNLIEKIRQKNAKTTSRKHGNYEIEIVDWIENISDFEEVVRDNLLEPCTPKREIFITRKISKNKVQELHWKVKGYYLLVYEHLLLKVDYLYEHKVKITH